MRAAINFSYGDGKKSRQFMVGDEVPDSIAKELADKFLLEKQAKNDPKKLTREQLEVLAGVRTDGGSDDGDSDGDDDGQEKLNESDLRESFENFKTRAELVDWFDTYFPESGVELDPTKMKRADIEDAIVAAIAV
jgi:hypothetical protein